MEISEAVEFVRTHHQAVLATTKRDGTPQLSPVTVGADGEGRIVMSTREPTAKVKNLRRDPHAYLCVFTDRFYGPWIQVTGDVEIVPLPDALPLLEDYYRRISGEHPDWEDYRAAMVRDERCLVRITPTKAVSG
jgi:PPOX class probable F420-dependent enzyme